MSPDRTGPVAAVLLAAGASARMGRNKLLLTLQGETVLRRAARAAIAAGLDPVLVVLGHEAERCRAELEGLACRAVLNPHHERGQNASLAAGIAAVPPGAPGALVALADMPFVTATMMAALVERFRADPARLVVSEYGGVLAPPMLYDRALFPELSEQEGDGCGKRVVKRHREEASIVSWPAAALEDLDLPDDYARAQAALRER
jgi:molybdenum cofactor cytidylyltransferase